MMPIDLIHIPSWSNTRSTIHSFLHTHNSIFSHQTPHQVQPLLPICVCVSVFVCVCCLLLEHDQLNRDHSFKENWLSSSCCQLPTSILAQGGTSCPYSFSLLRFCLATAYKCCHNCCELVCATTLLCLQIIVSLFSLGIPWKERICF